MHNHLTRRAATVAAGTLLALAGSTSAFAAAGGASVSASNLQCFSGTTDGYGYSGTCATSGKSNNVATLSNNSTNPNGDYSGVSLNKKDLNGKLLSSVTSLGYAYSGPGSFGAGDLSLNLGVDTTGDGLTDAYAYIDAVYCSGTNGAVDVIHDANCGIWFNNVEYANWSALVAAVPGATIAKQDGQPFIVAERTPAESSAVWTISNVVLG